METYPVVFEVAPRMRWERMQVLLRVAILIVLGFLGMSLGWALCALYVILPVLAAILISREGADGYIAGPGARVLRVLRWWNAFVAYFFMLTDRFPATEEDLAAVRFDVVPRGTPTVGSALLRLVTSLPEALVLAVLLCLGGLVWLVAAGAVLINERVPGFALRYLRFLVALQARMFVYHASLVDLYPPLGHAEGVRG